MEITLRKAEMNDLDECVRVEKAAMKDHCYLGDAWNIFFGTTGDLTCGVVEDKICGIGKFTLLADQTAWLETLRVDPAYQGHGIGKAIYQRYFEEAEQYGCPSMAMYTGVNNQVSAGLARKNGFEKIGEFRGYRLKNIQPDGKEYPFTLMDPISAGDRLMTLKETHGGHLVLNRTFYPFNPENIGAMAMDSLVFENVNTGSVVVCGARFQHLKAMHIAIMGGDFRECLEFVKRYAYAHEIPEIICTFPLPNEQLEAFLMANGFEKEASDLMVMERKLP